MKNTKKQLLLSILYLFMQSFCPLMCVSEGDDVEIVVDEPAPPTVKPLLPPSTVNAPAAVPTSSIVTPPASTLAPSVAAKDDDPDIEDEKPVQPPSGVPTPPATQQPATASKPAAVKAPKPPLSRAAIDIFGVRLAKAAQAKLARSKTPPGSKLPQAPLSLKDWRERSAILRSKKMAARAAMLKKTPRVNPVYSKGEEKFMRERQVAGRSAPIGAPIKVAPIKTAKPPVKKPPNTPRVKFAQTHRKPAALKNPAVKKPRKPAIVRPKPAQPTTASKPAQPATSSTPAVILPVATPSATTPPAQATITGAPAVTLPVATPSVTTPPAPVDPTPTVVQPAATPPATPAAPAATTEPEADILPE